MTHAVCPGSFDPPTLGHLDIVGRTAGLFDRVTVAVLINPAKAGLFSIEERLDLLRGEVAGWDNVEVDAFTGLLVHYCTQRGINAIVKGLRAVSDFDYELQMAQMNKGLTGPSGSDATGTAGGIDTLFMPTSPEFSFISSSLVKQVAEYGGDVSAYLSPAVFAALTRRLGDTSR